jgi:predicted AAA+ superfamily ATPase
LVELERRKEEVSYVKTAKGFEVDFLARYPSGDMDLIQVCAEVEAPDTAQRELRALGGWPPVPSGPQAPADPISIDFR